MINDRTSGPLLGVKHRAAVVSDTALVVYYTGDGFHLKRLELEIQSLESELEGLRLAVQAARSRLGGDPLAEVEW